MEQPKNPGGRPPVPDEKRLVQRSIRLTPAQWAKIDAHGLAWLRAIEDTRLAFEQMILDNHAGRAEIVARAPDGSYKFMAAESAWVVWKAAARWALDQAQATDDGVVRAFEHWYSDEGAWPAAVERRGGQYVLSQANSAWGVWRAGAGVASCAHRSVAPSTGRLTGQLKPTRLWRAA